MIYKSKECLQSSFQGWGVAGLADIEWESVSGLGVCSAEGSLAELKVSIVAKIGPGLTQMSGLWVEQYCP